MQILDKLFGINNFRGDIVFRKSLGHALANGYDNVTETIWYYSKSSKMTINTLYNTLMEESLEKKFPYTEEETGRQFNHEKLEKSSNKKVGDKVRIVNGKEYATELGWVWSQKTFDERLRENPLCLFWKWKTKI